MTDVTEPEGEVIAAPCKRRGQPELVLYQFRLARLVLGPVLPPGQRVSPAEDMGRPLPRTGSSVFGVAPDAVSRRETAIAIATPVGWCGRHVRLGRPGWR